MMREWTWCNRRETSLPPKAAHFQAAAGTLATNTPAWTAWDLYGKLQQLLCQKKDKLQNNKLDPFSHL